MEQQFECVADEDSGVRFRLFKIWHTRHPTLAFSVGLQALLLGRDDVILCRYNGGNHRHTNKIEGNRLHGAFHIHIATSRYIEKGFDPEGFAERSDRFHDPESALRCLVRDCSIGGILPSDNDRDTPSTGDLFA